MMLGRRDTAEQSQLLLITTAQRYTTVAEHYECSQTNELKATGREVLDFSVQVK